MSQLYFTSKIKRKKNALKAIFFNHYEFLDLKNMHQFSLSKYEGKKILFV